MGLKWWQEAVFYQIYPRSFADGNGDGIGDLAGMHAKLDYLADLGVDALWLSPFYPSPLYDCGYDVADYTDIAPEYGTLAEFHAFLDAAHARGLRLIIDLVLNHTSHEHRWFRASRASRDNPYRDWYIWRDGRDGGPPNNWMSTFGGSAWEYDPQTDQYYYHFFLKEQPDLNWRNPEVKAALFADARFWLEMGVDGFRLDAIDTIFEHPDLPDHEATLSQAELLARSQKSSWEARDPEVVVQWEALYEYQLRQPGIHTLFKELRALVDTYPDRVLVGETDDVAYYGSGDDELHLVFNFSLMRTPRLTPAWIRDNQRERTAALPPGAWPCNTLGNHDAPRVYNRYGDGEHDAELARLSLALMLTLRGTPFLYNGEEIGMTDYLLPDVAQFRDLLGLWYYRLYTEDLGATPEEAHLMAAQLGRDKCRTPLQWANAPHGGFCPAEVTPWLPVNPNYVVGVNVVEQQAAPASLLNFYRQLLHLRRETPALIAGDVEWLSPQAEDYLAFVRFTPEQRCLVALNFSPTEQQVPLALEALQSVPVFSRVGQVAPLEIPGLLTLMPFEIYLAILS